MLLESFSGHQYFFYQLISFDDVECTIDNGGCTANGDNPTTDDGG